MGRIRNVPKLAALAWLSCLPRYMDNGHAMRDSFKNIPNNWPIWADGPGKLLGIWHSIYIRTVGS